MTTQLVRLFVCVCGFATRTLSVTILLMNGRAAVKRSLERREIPGRRWLTISLKNIQPLSFSMRRFFCGVSCIMEPVSPDKHIKRHFSVERDFLNMSFVESIGKEIKKPSS